MSEKTTDKTKSDRRSFLKLAGVSAATGGLALAAKPQTAAAEEATANGGYRETDHVRKYYESTRF